MKSVEPSADLPPASSHTMLTYSALPVRRPYQQQHRDVSKNMTGVYLSHDAYALPSNKQQQQRIPPLARPRGMVYKPQTLPGFHKQQHRHDTVVRKRGDVKAFQPLPIKKAKPKIPRHEYHGPSPHVIGPKPDIHAVTRKSARNHVPASNDGLTHFEDLRSLSSGNSDKTTHSVEVIETMLDSIDLAARESEKSLAGLVECYKKICKGNASSVHSLVASRTSPIAKHKKRTVPANNANAPLVIRSFRNPQHPHSVVQYSNPRERGVVSPHSSTRPPVPAPYFYSSRGLPQTADEGGNRVKLTRLPGATSRNSNTVLAAPGAGAISRSAGSRTGSSISVHRLPDGIEGTRPPSLQHNAKIMDSDEVYMLKENFHVPASTPVPSTVDITKMSESEAGERNSTDSPEPGHRQPVVTMPGSDVPGSSPSSLNGGTLVPTAGDAELISVTGESVDMESTTGEAQGGTMMEVPSLAIVISLEDDDGTVKTVDFEEEERKQADSGPSETDVHADEVAEKLKETQAKKQAELDQLLEEHHQLVSQIEELEKKKGQEGEETTQDESD